MPELNRFWNSDLSHGLKPPTINVKFLIRTCHDMTSRVDAMVLLMMSNVLARQDIINRKRMTTSNRKERSCMISP